MQRTRNTWICPIFGEVCEINASVLPTYEDVMKCYEWTRYQIKLQSGTAQEPRFSEIADIVTSRVEQIWQTIFIPTVTRKRVKQKLKAYHSKCKNLLKSIKRLSTEKLECFRQRSKLLFDIAACKCKELPLCTCPKDKKVPIQETAFLIDQRSSRNMMIGRNNITTTGNLQITCNRQEEREDSQISPTTALNTSSPILGVQSSLSSNQFSSCESRISPGNFTNIVYKGIPKKEKPLCIMFPTLSKTCIRYGISDRTAAAIRSSVLLDIESNIKVIASYMHKVQRERSKTKQKVIKEIGGLLKKHG